MLAFTYHPNHLTFLFWKLTLFTFTQNCQNVCSILWQGISHIFCKIFYFSDSDFDGKKKDFILSYSHIKYFFPNVLTIFVQFNKLPLKTKSRDRLAQWKSTQFVKFNLQGTAARTSKYARIFWGGNFSIYARFWIVENCW